MQGELSMKQLIFTLFSVLCALFIAACSGKTPLNASKNDDDIVSSDIEFQDDDSAIHDVDLPQPDKETDGENSDNDAEPDEDTFVCPERRKCKKICCEEDEMCYNDRCVADCETPSKLCGEHLELCCSGNTVCLQGTSCVVPGKECTYSEDCELDEYCEPTLKKCIPRNEGTLCEYRPPVGDFAPKTACVWTAPPGDKNSFSDVVMAPVVGNLTDDNGDGVTDTNDYPDIAFISFDYKANGCCTAKGVLRIVDGRCNPDGTMRTIATLDDVWMDNSGGLVIANLDPPSEKNKKNPEIIAVFQMGGTIAWRRTKDDGSEWEIMWKQDNYLNSSYTKGATQPSVADVNGDGLPEIIVGNVVLNGQTGALIWDGKATSAADHITGGIGNNSFLGPSSVVADVDLDGTPEVIAGNTVYDGKTGKVKYHYTYTTSNSSCGHSGSLPCDGLDAIGNFDDDPEAEIAIIRLGELFILNHDMTLKYRFELPVDDCKNNEGGPPTIADFDGDGQPEVGVAGSDYYIVFDIECAADPLPAKCAEKNVLWKVENHDCSSRVTGSSVFDFDGDGKAEVVYADETNFRIFDGTTGKILFDDDTHRSNTRMEMPVLADIDNDMKVEVLVPVAAKDALYGGLEVWKDSDNNWVRTRHIWNQHSYHVTNITEDGQVPSPEEPNWLHSRLNNFRQNVQPAGVFDAPDLTIDSIAFDKCLFPSGKPVVARFLVTVKNKGLLGVGAGVPMLIDITEQGVESSMTVVKTTAPILPGNTEEVPVEFEIASYDSVFSIGATIDLDDKGGHFYNECDESNNYSSSDPRSCFGDS